MNERIGVIGLGYVGLPVALALARKFSNTVGFDIDAAKVDLLRSGVDRTGEIEASTLLESSLRFTSDLADLRGVSFFVVAVPTPIDKNHRPDLTPLIRASETIAKVIERGSVVVYESTVYPGVTEEICGGVIERGSGLKRGTDFKLGYSPERINPGDREHTLERIVKVVSGEDAESLDRVAVVYGAIVPAGIHRAPSIRVAEAAKVIENTQRDLNIALMNELAIIFDKLDISTRDVLAAARTKWNFLNFTPGLVGGHCIGVDPYYLTSKAEEVGYYPQVILAGRRINDGMGQYLAQRTIKMLIQADLPVKGARVGILGLTFKEDVPDLRNSRVPDIAAELRAFGITPLIHDPLVDSPMAQHEYGVDLAPWEAIEEMDGLIIAVGHSFYKSRPTEWIRRCVRNGGVIVDVKSLLAPSAVPPDVHYWSL